jgi:hypothetical protein
MEPNKPSGETESVSCLVRCTSIIITKKRNVSLEENTAAKVMHWLQKHFGNIFPHKMCKQRPCKYSVIWYPSTDH